MDLIAAEEFRIQGEQLLDIGHWDEAENYLFRALEHAEQEHNLNEQAWTTLLLGRLCRYRGNFSQAMILYQQVQRFNDQLLLGVIYNEIGETYRGQGGYPQAIEYYKKAIEVMQQAGENVAPSYGNLGIVYRQQGDFSRAIEAHQKALEFRH